MSPNITVITKFKGNVQLAEGGGHFYIVWVTGSGEPEIERELTRELCWLTAYTLDNLERLDFKPFDLRPETEEELYYEQARLADEEDGEPCHCEKCMKFYLSQATEDEVREKLRRAQAEPVPSRQWFTELKAKFHSKEGIEQLAREHANDSLDDVEDL